MIRSKSSLLATAVVSLIASQTSAQVALNAPDTATGVLRGAGASSIQNPVVRNFNCIGSGTTIITPAVSTPYPAYSRTVAGVTTLVHPAGTRITTPAVTSQNADKRLGRSSSATAFTTISPGNFAGAIPLVCATRKLQPNTAGEYVSTGSGFGRTMWGQFNDNFDGAAPATTGAQTISTGVFNPFGSSGRWPNLQFAFSDAGLTQAGLTTYNANAAIQAGPAITFPMFVLPVAIAFPTTYGTTANGIPMVFNGLSRGINGSLTIRLSKAAYCGIFNGTIKNWNDAAIRLRNGTGATGVSLQDLTNDTTARWNADGVPIRLVGRLDRSGTTDVFTRHLAAACNSANGYAGVNNYTQAAESLPYNAASNGNVDFRSVRSDVSYRPGVASSALAGTTNLISGDYWNGTAIVNIAAGTPTSLPTGNVGSGLFLVADGSSRVASAIVAAPDFLLNGVRLNGKVGYISADFVQPSVDAPAGLQAAALQVANTTTYAVPTVMAALKGITQLPPQSDSTGLFTATVADTRLVTPVTGSTKVPATRANPLAWAEVLYADSTNTLADPQAAGSYPITGTTQFFGYTCYQTNNRLAMANHLGLVLNAVKKDSVNLGVTGGTFGGTVPANPGINVQGNIGIMPKAWQTALANTFLTNSADAGALGLYIQTALVATAGRGTPGTGGFRVQVNPAANPVCSALPGA